MNAELANLAKGIGFDSPELESINYHQFQEDSNEKPEIH